MARASLPAHLRVNQPRACFVTRGKEVDATSITVKDDGKRDDVSVEDGEERLAAETLMCMSLGKREEVDRLVEEVRGAQGKTDSTNLPSNRFMNGRNSDYFDENDWQVMWRYIEGRKKLGAGEVKISA